MEVLNSYQRQKLDESNDEDFYSDPKFVYHLDSSFRTNLTSIYKEELNDNAAVLDLMSSWDSYLPSEKNYSNNMNDLKRGKKNRSKNALFNPYTNGISTYDLAYLSSKRVKKNKTAELESNFTKEYFVA